MAVGWARDGAVQEQIDATVSDAVARARSHMICGESLTHCDDCGAEIPVKRRLAVPGVRRCVACQQALDKLYTHDAGVNRRGNKDSQLK
jgi:phage/conjugal plasmid C-4 type zinc finger TraR family protein